MKTTLGAIALVTALAGPAVARAQEPVGAAGAQRLREAPAFAAVLGDTALSRLIAQALVANRDVHVAQARVRAARAARASAAYELAPIVTAGGGYARQRLPSAAVPGAAGVLPDQDVWDAGVRLDWEVDLFGRSRNVLRGRRAFAAAAAEDLRDVQVLVAAELATAYYDLRGALDRLASAQRNAENQRSTLALTLERLEAGRGTAFDTERARAQLSSTLAEVPRIEAAVAAIQHRIAVLIGRPPASAAPVPGPGTALPMLPEEVAVPNADSLLRLRPDVLGAERNLAARSALAGAARARYLPQLTLSGSAGYTSGSAGGFGDRGTARYAVGPVLSWPLLDIGRVKAGADGARAEEADARARYEQTVLRAQEDLATSLVSYRRARERLTHLEDAAAASERAAELARTRFREGASDFLPVLDAERTLLEAQDRRAQGRTETITALVAAFRALGGTWPVTPPASP